MMREKLANAHPEIREILSTLATGAKEISVLLQTINRKKAGTFNASGDEQLALDMQADNILFHLYSDKRLVREYASEEREAIIPVNPQAGHSITVDPLDGSSLLDVNLSVGTIIGVWEGSVLKGELVAAAYIIYGPNTIMVFSVGDNVHEYVLEQTGSRLLQEVCLDEKGSIYSIGGLRSKWSIGHKRFIDTLENNAYKLRYSGGLVPDMHQILLKKGGIFSYPALHDYPQGKLRLLFELCPFAFLVEQAGGAATDGNQRILNIERKTLHQRSPVYIGSKTEVMQAKEFLEESQ